MNIEATQESSVKKLETLTPFTLELFTPIKKDLKQGHLKKDPKFCKQHLKTPLTRATFDEIITAYKDAIQHEQPQLLEFIFQRWLLKHTDIYSFFANELESLDEDFTQITSLDPEFSFALIEKSVAQFDAITTYLFSVINSVVFPQEVFAALRSQALEQQQRAQETPELPKDPTTALESEMKKMINKYEKKLAGWEKKYLDETERLKKQIKTLQRKLDGNSC